MNPVKFAVVIPVGAGRRENLEMVLECLVRQTFGPEGVVIVCDGEDAWIDARSQFTLPTIVVQAPKHEPGMEQPRNIGVRIAERHFDFTHVAFLDSDIIFKDDLLERYLNAIVFGGREGIYYGPYEWLSPGDREIDEEFYNDPRWAMFREEGDDPRRRFTGDLSKGLGCFSGNLVWNVEDFKRTGGFWDEIHHGRCEDGELGLRAVAMGVPIGLVPAARGYHLDHKRNWRLIEQRNVRDVPMLNARHPWVEGRCACGAAKEEHSTPTCDKFEAALFVVDEDGKRFNARCKCGWEGNTALLFQHRADCPGETVDYERSPGAPSA